MDAYIITGASKGIGLALSRQLLNAQNHLVCIARSRNRDLEKQAKASKCSFQYIEQDLSDTETLPALVRNCIQTISKDVKSVTLINNAGVIDPIGQVESLSSEAIVNSITINLTVPMLLTSLFIRALEAWPVKKKIVNISSGAGRHPYSGWSSYCAGKAGLDHFTRVVSEEQANKRNGAKVISIAPGIIDTGMQEKIRSVTAEDFSLVDKFIAYKENKQLQTPEQTAEILIKFIQSPNFDQTESIADLRTIKLD